MKRKYERELFAQRVNYINKVMPRAFIAADVIVGFPGETEENFEDTKDFANKRKLIQKIEITKDECKEFMSSEGIDNTIKVFKEERINVSYLPF